MTKATFHMRKTLIIYILLLFSVLSGTLAHASLTTGETDEETPSANLNPIVIIPAGTGTCTVTDSLGGFTNNSFKSGNLTFIDAFNVASLEWCGLQQYALSPANFASHKVTIDLSTLPPAQYTETSTITLGNEYMAPNLTFVPGTLPTSMERTLYVHGRPHVEIQLGCFTIGESMDISSLAIRTKVQWDLSMVGNEHDVDYCGDAKYFLEFWTFNPTRLSSLYLDATSYAWWTNTGVTAGEADGQSVAPQTSSQKKWRQFQAVIGVPQQIMVDGQTELDVHLSEIVIDLMSRPAEMANGTFDADGLHLPAKGKIHVQRLITQFDPNIAHKPIQYRDMELIKNELGGAIDAKHFDVPSPVPTPSNLKLTRSENMLTLSGSVAAGVVRIEAYRPARQSAYVEYWRAYQRPDQATLDWAQMIADGKFVELKFADPSKSNTFSIDKLPLYTMGDFSDCEWKKCNNAGKDNACAFGRGYVVTAFDKDNRPSEVKVTTSYASTDDYTSIRLGCAIGKQNTDPPQLTDAQCDGNEHVEDNFCVPLSCAVGQIITNHACQSCPTKQTAQGNACVMKMCPAGQELNGNGSCVAKKCGTGEILSAGSCVCDAAHGYSKELGTGSCAKDDDDNGDDEDVEDDDTDNSTDDADTDDVDNTADDFTCGPGMVLFGVYGCIPQAACSPGTVRNSPYGVCTPAGGFGQSVLFPTNPFIPAQPRTNKPSGGCSLLQ